MIQSRFAVFVFVCLLLSPLFSGAQTNREADNDDQPVQQSSSNDGPWGNNNPAATIGASTLTEAQQAARPATNDPRQTGGAPGAARPTAGPTPDATGGPGGNPDVPFDASMNILFLFAGVAFAYLVYRKKFRVKPVPVQNK